MRMDKAMQLYQVSGKENEIASASPHKLILMLYEGALVSLFQAKRFMAEQDVARKGESLSKAISIIQEGLKASLNREVQQEMTDNLSHLYDFMADRVLLANLKNDPVYLDEVIGLLTDLKEAWQEITPDKPSLIGKSEEKSAAVSYGMV